LNSFAAQLAFNLGCGKFSKKSSAHGT